jgi:sugar lactone lactonase YvrE
MTRHAIVGATLVVGLLAGCAGSASSTPTASPVPPESSSPSSDPNRMVTIAGGGSALGDGGPATSAGMCGPSGVAVDTKGNVYIADSGLYCKGPGGHTVRRIDPKGIITTVAGTPGVSGFSGDGGPAKSAQLNFPESVAVDGQGNLYIADIYNRRIRKVDAKGLISTFAGTGEAGFSGDGGPATKARLFAKSERCDLPGGLAIDAQDNLYVADTGAVRRIDRTGTITTVAGTGDSGYAGDGGRAIEARLCAWGLAVARDGTIHVSDGTRVRRVDTHGVITTEAGGIDRSSTLDGIRASLAYLHLPIGLAVDSAGNLFIAEHHANRIRRIGVDGVITTVAGIFKLSSGGNGLFTGEEGPATAVGLNEPFSVFVDAAGVLYIADTFNARVRAVRFAGAH